MISIFELRPVFDFVQERNEKKEKKTALPSFFFWPGRETVVTLSSVLSEKKWEKMFFFKLLAFKNSILIVVAWNSLATSSNAVRHSPSSLFHPILLLRLLDSHANFLRHVIVHWRLSLALGHMIESWRKNGSTEKLRARFGENAWKRDQGNEGHSGKADAVARNW